MKSFRKLSFILLILSIASLWTARARVEFCWPTPSTAWQQGKGIEDFIQATVSGDPISGTFGDVRSHGYQFHEGIDIKPVGRDRHGEPTDKVYAAFAGVVRHINAIAGDSNYGRYIVIEHPDLSPGIYTLYAHLRSIQLGLREGSKVACGDVIAIMGHTSDRRIPRDRAHMHFEMGVMVTRNFQAWYDSRRFGSRNDHGLWNGMNLMGFDPLDFLNQYRARQLDDFDQYFKQMKTVVRLRIITQKRPDYIQRYPSLLKSPMPIGSVSGWEIDFNWTGIPFAWRPLTASEVMAISSQQFSFEYVDEAEVSRHHSKSIVKTIRGKRVPGKDLEIVLQQLFGLR